jgi:hypothetical protein
MLKLNIDIDAAKSKPNGLMKGSKFAEEWNGKKNNMEKDCGINSPKGNCFGPQG